jgi:hypothetical protein
MSFGIFNSVAFTVASGLAVAPNATVTVLKESDGTAATLYADAQGATPKANVFAADSSGRFSFYAAGIALGYRVTVTSGAESFTLRNVPVGTAMYLDSDAFVDAADIQAVQTNLDDHLADTTGAHAASAISFTPAGSIAATEVQAAIQELDTEKQPVDADLIAIAGLSSNGLIARTGSGTASVRTITGTANLISVSNGDGVSGNPTLTVGSAVARLETEDQVLTGGARVTSKDLGTISTGTVTPDPGDRPMQHYTNGGAHTLAPSANGGSTLVDITNNGSAGAITTSGFTFVSGDAFTTTNGHKFRCHISIGSAGSLLTVQALQ